MFSKKSPNGATAPSLITMVFIILGILQGGCATLSSEQRAQLRQEVDSNAAESLKRFLEQEPGLQQDLDQAAGVFIGQGWSGMVGPIGGSDGLGVLHNNQSGKRTYLDLNTLDIGVGAGAVDVEFLAILESEERVAELERGVWGGTRGMGSALGDSIAKTTPEREDVIVRLNSQSGAVAGAWLSMTRASVNEELTDTGISDWSVPSFDPENTTEESPRIWTHRMPFLAQKVVDRGFNLPLPYGAGVSYVSNTQDMLLDNLFVGFNGGPKELYEFVDFDNFVIDTTSYQAKLDTWLFPFMNVFALVGKVGGDAFMDIYLDGNGLLDEIGEDCSGLVPSLLCRSLEDQTILLPIRVDVDVVNWGFGTILAAGWKNWFLTLPMTLTYAEPVGSVADGRSITITPRGGRLIELPKLGSLALFAGANYLDSENTITGSFRALEPLVTIDYTVDQKNKDQWNIVAGFNWEINRHLSWAVEYNGFTGSREQWVTSFNVRF
jgi:lipid-binding SYLF domain-containing protein